MDNNKTHLKKELDLLDVYSLITGSIIGAGLFLLPGIAHAKAGNAVILSYLLAGLLVSTAMFSMAELVSAMPRAGGDYFVVKRIMGPAVGTIAGLLSWFFLSLKSALALMGMAVFTRFITDINIHTLAIGIAIFFLSLNLMGIKKAGRTQVVMTMGLLILLVFFIIRGLWGINIQRLRIFAPNGFMPIFATTGFIFVTYGGILKCVAVAGEIKNPGRTIPLGMILSLATVTVVYIMCVFITAGSLDADILHKSSIPLNDAAASFMGTVGMVIMSIAAILACVTTANGGIMAASRYPLALSQDGLLPDVFSRINARFNTPHIAILTTGLVIIFSLFLNIEGIAEVGSTVLLLTYILANICLIIMRECHIKNYKPVFRSPFYPWVQIIGIIGFIFLICQMGMILFLTSIAFCFVGFLIYWFYGRASANKESALLHLIQRITDKDLLLEGSLESELKEIVREREDVVKDHLAD